MADRASRFNNSRALFVAITVLILVPIAAGSVRRALASGEDGGDSFYREFSVFTEVLEHIRKRYVEDTGLEVLFSGAFDGAADALDPMATYVPAESVARYREARARGHRRSGLQIVRERGVLFVVGVAPGGPGAEAGLKSGDILSKLDGRSTRLTPLWEAQVVLSGESGSTVQIEVLRQGQTMDFELTLADFEAAPPSLEMREEVALVRVGEFETGLVEQLEELLQTPEVGASKGLILDLRSVAGGDYRTALAAADLFTDGSLGQLRERTKVVRIFSSEKQRVWNGPRLVVLTDRGSQGASEIFTAVLKQSAGSSTVGSRTFGHAGRTAARRLSDGAEFYFTDAFYVAPDGMVLNEPLDPDVHVGSANRRLSDADRPLEDLVLDRALDLALGREASAKEAA